MVGIYSIEEAKFLILNNGFSEALKENGINLDIDFCHQLHNYVSSKNRELVKSSINNFLKFPSENSRLKLKYHVKFPKYEAYVLHELLIRKLEGQLYAINYFLDITDMEKIENCFDVSKEEKEKNIIVKKLRQLSPRQREVLQLISDGYSSKQIANLLSLSDHTIISHRKNLIEKFDAKNTAHLIKKTWDSVLSINNEEYNQK